MSETRFAFPEGLEDIQPSMSLLPSRESRGQFQWVTNTIVQEAAETRFTFPEGLEEIRPSMSLVPTRESRGRSNRPFHWVPNPLIVQGEEEERPVQGTGSTTMSPPRESEDQAYLASLFGEASRQLAQSTSPKVQPQPRPCGLPFFRVDDMSSWLDPHKGYSQRIPTNYGAPMIANTWYKLFMNAEKAEILRKQRGDRHRPPEPVPIPVVLPPVPPPVVQSPVPPPPVVQVVQSPVPPPEKPGVPTVEDFEAQGNPVAPSSQNKKKPEVPKAQEVDDIVLPTAPASSPKPGDLPKGERRKRRANSDEPEKKKRKLQTLPTEKGAEKRGRKRSSKTPGPSDSRGFTRPETSPAIKKLIADYVQRADLTLLGASWTQNKLEKALLELREEFDCGEKWSVDLDLDQLIILMGDTFKLRSQELTNNQMDIHECVPLFPGLAVPRYLPHEFFLKFPEKLGEGKLMEEIDNVLLSYFVAAESRPKPAPKDKDLESLVVKRLQAVDGNIQHAEKLVLGAVLMAHKRSKGKANGTLYFKGKRKAKRTAPTIKVDPCTPLFALQHPMTVIIEGKDVCQADNFYTAIYAVYLYYWVFYLDYQDVDAAIFSPFDLATSKPS